MTLLADEEWRAKGINWMAERAEVSVGLAHKMYHEQVSIHGEKMERPAVREAERNGVTYTTKHHYI